MKKASLLLFVLAAGLLVVSCGKSRKPEVKEAAKIASEGIFGSIGEDLVYLMDDYNLIDEEYEKKNEELKQELFSGSGSESKAKKAIEKEKAMKEERDAKRDEVKKQFVSYVEELKGKELPTEIDERTPLKLVSPFTIVSIDKTSFKMIAEAKVEIINDRAELDSWSKYKMDYIPYAVFLDGDGYKLHSDRNHVPTNMDEFSTKLTAGTTKTVAFSLSFYSPKALSKVLAAKKISIRWERPNR